MLFNSVTFLFYFLPTVFGGFLILAYFKLQRAAGLWLTLASLVFYGWWNPQYVPLLLGSMAFNYWLGGVLMRRRSRAFLFAGIAANVALLGYFKYTGFVIQTAADVAGASWAMPQILLPLAISFFTFQQIAYLVDANDGEVTEHGFLNYCLFITFFPHLIAGPITHHREMLPQFSNADRFRPRWDLVAVGMTLFFIGLFKKVLVADPFGTYARPIFEQARIGGVQFLEAWTGALSYTLQIYFDFSGYTDMAIGLGLLFGISLPPNFNSPYKARNIIDFWNRWHMTLTRFLTAYIYNPIVVAMTRRRATKGLPLPRRGRMSPETFVALVAFPTIFTMFISGVWHGAGWQFVAFGLLHGVYLIVAHAWRQWKVHQGIPLESANPLNIAASVGLTFLCVMVALVFFRAHNIAAALDILSGMAGLNGAALPQRLQTMPLLGALAEGVGASFGDITGLTPSHAVRIVLFLIVVWAFPNSIQWLRNFPTALNLRPPASWLERYSSLFRWRPSIPTGVAMGAVSVVVMLYATSVAPTEFLYFQF